MAVGVRVFGRGSRGSRVPEAGGNRMAPPPEWELRASKRLISITYRFPAADDASRSLVQINWNLLRRTSTLKGVTFSAMSRLYAKPCWATIGHNCAVSESASIRDDAQTRKNGRPAW